MFLDITKQILVGFRGEGPEETPSAGVRAR